MELKEPPTPTQVIISTFLLHKERYVIDPTYQREAGTWTRRDEQYFVDTIIRGYGMPAIFLHKKGKSHFIVDGQQRIRTIWRFKDNKFPLSDFYSKDIITDTENRNKYKGECFYRDLSDEWKNRFEGYPLPITLLENYNDEEVRDLFRRLQHGKPLVAGEIINACPGEMVLLTRELSKHKFFTEVIKPKTKKYKRYKQYYLVAILLYLEQEDIKEIKPTKIYNFYDQNKELSKNSIRYKKVKKTLNYIVHSFKNYTPELLSKPPWIITLYLLVSDLLENYSMEKQEKNLKEFFIKFHDEVENSEKTQDEELKKFKKELSEKTNDRTVIKSRYDIIKSRCLNSLNLHKLDENRLFTHKQKIAIFRRDNDRCHICHKVLTFDSPDTHFHHIDRYTEGGKTEVDKGQLVCKDCHLNKIHGKSD